MSRLPPDFEALEPYAGKWAIGGETERAALRSMSTSAERAQFYGTAMPLLGSMLDYLDRFNLADLADPQRLLLQLALSLANVARAEETLRDAEADHMPSRDRLKLVNRSGF